MTETAPPGSPAHDPIAHFREWVLARSCKIFLRSKYFLRSLEIFLDYLLCYFNNILSMIFPRKTYPAVVKVYATNQQPDWESPWQSKPYFEEMMIVSLIICRIGSVTGSGAIIRCGDEKVSTICKHFGEISPVNIDMCPCGCLSDIYSSAEEFRSQ